MFIPPGPSLINQLNRKRKETLIEWFPAKQSYYVNKGRAAMTLALLALGVSSNTNVLIPAYLCKTALTPVLSRSNSVSFYPVRQDLTVNTKDFEEAIEKNKPAVLILIHYFGFPDPNLRTLLEISKNKEVHVLEDCAHALFSRWDRKNLGQLGQASIFSLVKSLPLPEGGILFLKKGDKNLEKQIDVTTTGFICEIINLVRMLFYSTEAKIGFSLRPLILSMDRLKLKIYEINESDSDDLDIRAMGPISKRLLRSANPEWIIERRRSNFEYLLEHFDIDSAMAKPIYSELPKGVCPMGFPVIIKKGRDRVARNLYRQGIGIRTIWDILPDEIPLGRFPDSHYVRDHILVLPVHQDINFNQLEIVIERLKRELKRL